MAYATLHTLFRSSTSQHTLKHVTGVLFNLTPGVGRTDGEAPEQGWANIICLRTVQRRWSPGTGCDTIDDHFGDWNG